MNGEQSVEDKKEWTKLMIRHDIALFKLWQTHLALNLALAKPLNSKDLKRKGRALKKSITPKAGGVS